MLLGFALAVYLGGVIFCGTVAFVLTAGFPGKSSFREKAATAGMIFGWPVAIPAVAVYEWAKGLRG